MSRLHLLLALCLGVLFLGCIQPSEGVKYVCSDGSVVSDKSLCPITQTSVVQAINIETELSVCSDMPTFQSVSLEDYCIIGLAGKHENISLCRKASSDRRKDCYAMIAEIANNADLCAEAGALKDQCYDQYARDMRDVSVCDKMTDVNYKDSCYSNMASSAGDPALCEKIRNVNQKDSCYFNMAMRFSDSSYCNKIVNSQQKQNCLQNLQQSMPGPIKTQN